MVHAYKLSALPVMINHKNNFYAQVSALLQLLKRSTQNQPKTGLNPKLGYAPFSIVNLI